MRRSDAHAQRRYAYASLALIVTAFAIWNGTKEGLCDPHSLIQGHAIWHILGAAAAYVLYRYYASEEVGDPALRELPPRGASGSVPSRSQVTTRR